MGILYVHVSEGASESEHEQAREALEIALRIDAGQTSERVSQPAQRVTRTSAQATAQPSPAVPSPAGNNHGAPAKGSPEAKARMAAVREAKASKASGQASKASKASKATTPKASKASSRMAALAAKAGLVAEPDPQPAQQAKATTSTRFTLPEFAADLNDEQEATLVAFCDRLVDQRKLEAMVLYLQGKVSRDDLAEIPSRGGSLAEHATRTVRRAERGEDA